jgi:hypothetical protein
MDICTKPKILENKKYKIIIIIKSKILKQKIIKNKKT